MRQASRSKKRAALVCAMISSALILGMTGISQAEEQSDYSFDQVVVTATKTPVEQFEANANISVVTREQIENNHYQNLSEALRDVPGVNVSLYGNSVGFEYSNSISINGSPQIVVLIDGVRANTNGSDSTLFPTGLLNDMDNIERIEVLKGAASTLYGSDAKGGVINIITRKADVNKTTLTIGGGSYDKENYSLANRGRDGDYSWVVTSRKDISGTYANGNGEDIPSHSNSTTNTFKLTKKINSASDVTFSYDRYQGDYTRINNAKDFTLKDGDNDNSDWKFIYNYKFSDNAANQLSFYQNKHKMSDATNTPSSNWFMDLKTKGVQDQFTQKMGQKHTGIFGFDIYQDSIDYRYGTSTAYNDKKITDRAVYMQDEWQMNDKWKLTSGVRNDHHSIYGNHASPSFNLGYKQDDKTNYYVAFKKYFVSPNMDELYNPYMGTTVLKPETGHTTEGGINHKFDDTFTASAHIFETSTDNAIGYIMIDPVNYTYRYVNVGNEIAHGWDVQLNKKMSPFVTMYVNYTNTTYKMSTAGADGIIMGYDSMPQGMWNIGMTYRQKQYDVGLQGHGNVALPGVLPTNTYWVWDMAVNYKIEQNKRAFVMVNNLFDKYYAVYGSPVYGYYTCPGRNVQVGVQYQF
ncbi:MAG: TonB-dependent receptor [Veillonellales bacterium]